MPNMCPPSACLFSSYFLCMSQGGNVMVIIVQLKYEKKLEWFLHVPSV